MSAQSDSRASQKSLQAQAGVVHILPLLIIVAVAGLAVWWFFFKKVPLNLPSSSVADKIISLKPKPFQDVSSDNKNYTAIKYLAREGVIKGDENGSFNPNKKLTRSQWAVLLVRLAGVEPDQSIYKNCYKDVGVGQEEAAICYSKEQGWFNDSVGVDTYLLFNLVQTVNAQENQENFNPQNPIKDAEAVGSLARMMDWEPGKTLTDEEALAVAKEKNIIDFSNNELTKGEAAEIIYRSLGTVAFDQEEYTPSINKAVNRQKAADLVDAKLVEVEVQEDTDAREEWARVKNSAIKYFAEGSGIGYDAATEIVNSSATYSEALKKIRQYRYNQWLADRTSDGASLQEANLLKAAQQFITAKGGQQQITANDVLIFKSEEPEADFIKTSDASFTEGQAVEMILVLDENYQMLTREQWDNTKIGYILEISAGDMFLWDNQNFGYVFADLVNFKTGVIEQSHSAPRDNYEFIGRMFNTAVNGIEAKIGRGIIPPAKSEATTGRGITPPTGFEPKSDKAFGINYLLHDFTPEECQEIADLLPVYNKVSWPADNPARFKLCTVVSYSDGETWPVVVTKQDADIFYTDFRILYRPKEDVQKSLEEYKPNIDPYHTLEYKTELDVLGGKAIVATTTKPDPINNIEKSDSISRADVFLGHCIFTLEGEAGIQRFLARGSPEWINPYHYSSESGVMVNTHPDYDHGASQLHQMMIDLVPKVTEAIKHLCETE